MKNHNSIYYSQPYISLLKECIIPNAVQHDDLTKFSDWLVQKNSRQGIYKAFQALSGSDCFSDLVASLNSENRRWSSKIATNRQRYLFRSEKTVARQGGCRFRQMDRDGCA